MVSDSNVRLRGLRLAGIVMAASLILASCSSASGEQDAGGNAPEAEVALDTQPAEADTGEDGAPTPEDAADEQAGVEQLSAEQCLELLMNRGAYSTIAGALGRSTSQAEAEAMLEFVDIAESRAAIALYVPHQDVVPEVFGPLREGIETLSADLDAFEAGTFSGPTGEYGVVNIVPVLEVLGC